MKYRVNINLGENEPMTEEELETLQTAVEESLAEIGYETGFTVKVKAKED